MADNAREEAVRRLDEAVVEEDSLGERHRLAIGTATEWSAYGRLRAACDDVVHRYVQLKTIDDAGTGGRIWINGREIGGTDARWSGLERSHD